MKRKRITRENLSLLATFFDYAYLDTVDKHLTHQIHNLTVYLETGINYEDVRSESGQIFLWLNGILSERKLFAVRRTTGRLDMECDKTVELVKYSIRISRIVPGWYFPDGHGLCRYTHRPIWWKIASIGWEELRLVLRRETGEILRILYPPEQTAGYCTLVMPAGMTPPALDEADEQLVAFMLGE